MWVVGRQAKLMILGNYFHIQPHTFEDRLSSENNCKRGWAQAVEGGIHSIETLALEPSGEPCSCEINQYACNNKGK